jgi:hypothetical protein
MLRSHSPVINQTFRSPAHRSSVFGGAFDVVEKVSDFQLEIFPDRTLTLLEIYPKQFVAAHSWKSIGKLASLTPGLAIPRPELSENS